MERLRKVLLASAINETSAVQVLRQAAAEAVSPVTAAALLTATSLAAVNTHHVLPPVAEINGAKVIDLAPVVVRPSAEELRAASLITEAGIAGASGAVSLLGAQLAMPYYSFGAKTARAAKE